jgi:ABC-type transport system involved in multi-copper enzyme maturation permease subunit
VSGAAQRVIAIARLSASEMLRSRSMLIAAILNLLILALLGLAAYMLATSLPPELAAQLQSSVAREGAVRVMLLTVTGLASLLATFVGVFGSAGAIGGEIERGTILALAARPIGRWEIVIGKFLGNGTLVAAYLVAQMVVVTLVLGAITGVWVSDIWVSIALHALSVLLVVGVVVALSTLLAPVPNAIVVSVLTFALAGPGIGILFGIALLTDSPLLRQGVEWSRFVLPTGPLADLADQRLAGTAAAQLFRTAAGEGAGLFPVYDWVWIYALVYLVGALALGVWLLNRRDLR